MRKSRHPPMKESRHPVLMCLACGNFVPAVNDEGTLRALRASCPDCGGDDFTDVFAD